ncbi:MAG: D-glycero-beta-D-manno-heptose-7-phosphate kinase [Syntrophus sp. (in: bacteria)]|nr:D-glycero-beta-D-manno-heptose-7-phosphate kinase [Syntrophus sp. (in: bacteria)]
MAEWEGMKKILNQKRALEIIDRFSHARVLVVGDLMIDHFIRGKVSRISPEAPVPVVEVESDYLLLGGSANVSHNIHAMGGGVCVSGVVGADKMGKKLISEFRKRQIDTRGVVVEANRPTTLKTRIVAHSQQVVRFDRESRQPVTADSIERMLAYVSTLRDELGAIVISDYGKGVITQALLDGIRELVQNRNITICVDPKKSDFSLYEGCDIITPNHHEAGRAVGAERVSRENLIEVGTTLLSRYRYQALLITRGEEGMSLFEKNDRIRHTFFPTQAREVFDVTGAGDTAIGVFALCMASGATFKEAAFLANHAAGIVVGKVGTSTVSQAELKKVL